MRGHSVRLVASPRPLPAVLADPVRVEQVLANLLSNAGKYSSPGTEIVLHLKDDAKAMLQDVVARFPRSIAAQKAKARLAEVWPAARKGSSPMAVATDSITPAICCRSWILS